MTNQSVNVTPIAYLSDAEIADKIRTLTFYNPTNAKITYSYLIVGVSSDIVAQIADALSEAGQFNMGYDIDMNMHYAITYHLI